RSHRGWDPGALQVARHLSRVFEVPLVAGRFSRLVIDLNRSAHHPRLFSPWSKPLHAAQRQRLLALHAAHWAQVVHHLEGVLAWGPRVFHVAVHSFTPELDGERRNADIGLLYDPSRQLERELAARLKTDLSGAGCRVRLNYPYRGVADGLPTALRKRVGAAYAGLELELNQAFVGERGVPRLSTALEHALADALS
ncbi:MAG: N-formylglutamate amidohydrolase, partial [Myxococcales bacterium]|nr:N-formylglutamate amidohydrolase [Myxococcales bacterium]